MAAKCSTASLMRNLPMAEVKVLRHMDAMVGVGLFKVEKAGVFEVGIVKSEVKNGGDRCCEGAHAGRDHVYSPWEMAEALGDVSGYPWVLWLGSGGLVLRGVDHLLAGKADILWAPMPGVPVTAERSGAFLREEERAEGYRPVHPQSRPWREAASAAVWAVRGDFFAGLMAEWRGIAEGELGSAARPGGPLQSLPQAQSENGLGGAAGSVGPARRAALPVGASNIIESAWNRLLLDTPLRVARFERDEVQFPCLPGADFLKWKDACILNVDDWPMDAQSKFLQAWFYGTYFADPSGLFLDIVEP